MEVVHSRCAGLDVSKRDVKVCVRLVGVAVSTRSGPTMTAWIPATDATLRVRRSLWWRSGQAGRGRVRRH